MPEVCASISCMSLVSTSGREPPAAIRSSMRFCPVTKESWRICGFSFSLAGAYTNVDSSSNTGILVWNIPVFYLGRQSVKVLKVKDADYGVFRKTRDPDTLRDARGAVKVTVVPRPGVEQILKVPPIYSRRSRTLNS